MPKTMPTPELPWVVALFDPPALRVSPQEYRALLADPALRAQLPPVYRFVPLTTSTRPLAAWLLACRRAWARRGWRPYARWRRFGWRDGELTIHEPEEDDA